MASTISPRRTPPRRQGRALLVLAAGFCAVLVAAWLATRVFLARPDRAPREAGVPADAGPVHDRAPAELASPEPHTDAAPRTEPFAARGATAPAETAPTLAIDPTPREPVVVLVVDADGGAPVADAEVLWSNLADLAGAGEPRTRTRLDPFVLLAGAHRTTTDEQGLARIDARVFPGQIAARAGSRSGRTAVDAASVQPLIVRIAPETGLVLQVVDASDRPVVGVPVCLRAVPHLESMGELWSGITDEAGLARVRRVGNGPPPARAFAAIDALLVPSVVVDVDLSKPPPDPVRLVLPPTGSVRVALRDASGRDAEALLVHLGRADQADAKGDLRWSSRGFEPDEIGPGAALFRFAGLGLELHAVAMQLGGNPTARGPGPRTAGETAHLALDLGAPKLVLVGRLVDERGTPLAEREVQLAVETSGRSGARGANTSPRRTDARGRFRVATHASAGEATKLVLAARPIGLGPAEGGSVTAEIELASAPPEHDVGDLVVVQPRLLAEGIVVDERGAPVAGAQLTVQVLPHDGAAWARSPHVTARTFPGGRFEVRTTADAVRARVGARYAELAPSEVVECDPGTRDVRLVLGQPLAIVGRTLLDDGLPPSRVRVRAVGAGTTPADDPAARVQDPRLGDDGSFRVGPLRAGRYDLEFHLGWDGEPLHRVEGIEVAPGAGDARLDAVDLRGKVPSKRGA